MSKMSIEIVSDVMCPWCIIGYKNLEKALQQLPDIEADISWHAFELNPQMPPEGQDLVEHVIEKYGSTKEQSVENRKMIAQRGLDSGFQFNFSDDSKIINSFNCHRLLTWAKEHGKQTELKLALFSAHFTEGKQLNDDAQLLAVAVSIGLDEARARQILDSDEYAAEVRAEQNRMHQMGIQSVPTFIINKKYGISGGQPSEAFIDALTQINAEAQGASAQA
ncbi:DsbA family oxidoreductase [Reinekea marinisedimentorum]|uniref:Putative DsbA family dithiol-disulfide isomerase n=1 Tax=Reinekea marinisedimentorum TaxID=230495 RepID=A0A4R3I5T8_9GAMM|nr:DsbA family oxidoreductase [Reinekea marinisedimentorum]TCS40349.1 putative DsbA family dithiol-disulfide isomerase [Reinekea marinisedimentorum]